MTSSKPKTLLRSLLVAYVLSGIFLLILAFALYKLKLKEPQINLAVYFIYGLACLFGGLLTGKSLGQRRFFWGMLSGLLYYMVLFFISWLLNHGVLPDSIRGLTVMAICIISGSLGGILS